MLEQPTHLECFFLDTDLDFDLRGDEVDRESFLRASGEREGDLFSVELGSGLTGEDEFCSSTFSSERSVLSGLFSGSLDADLDLKTSCSTAKTAGAASSWVTLGCRIWASNLSIALSVGKMGSGTERTGFHPPAEWGVT